MTSIAKRYADRLPDLKKSVEESQKYFERNVKRYKEFMKFVFDTSLDQTEMTALQNTGKPTIEFNILESHINKLRGEFSKQMPSLSVRAADGIQLSQLTQELTDTIKVVEAYLRAIFFDAANDMLEYNIYSDLLAGGFSVMRVYTEYVNEMSFEQRICVGRVFDPLLCGFDPIARDSSKSDGKYCFELYPMTKEAFELEYGEEATARMKFTPSLEGFQWSFLNEQKEILLVCDYYEKKQKRVKIIKLSNGYSATEREYERFLKEWEKAGRIEQAPIPIPGNERWTTIETICRYRFCQSQMLGYVDTDYKYLPLVFVDGNSVTLHESGSSTQMTRPFVYHAKGIQRLKNFAGESLANELENTIQHKFVVALESIPEEYQTAYKNVQKADTLVYTHFLDTNNPEITLPPPREVNRTPIPPEITNTFRLSDEMTMAILGSYDGAASLQNADMSGIAFARSAMQSNLSAMPYIVGYIKGLNRVAQIIVDLIPKYYRTPRSLPILLPSGKRSYQEINKPGHLYMDYDPNAMEVKVECGVNFAMQKEIALNTITTLMSSSPIFAQFMNEHGLSILLDNIEIRGIEELKQKAEDYQKELAEQRQMAMQAQQAQMQVQEQQSQMAMAQAQKELQSPTQGQLGMMAIEQQAQRDQEKAVLDAGNLAIKEREAETKFLELMAKVKAGEIESEVSLAKADAENTRSEVNLAIELSKHSHEKELDIAKHEHEVRQSKKEND